jgi:hypothetical protein
MTGFSLKREAPGIFSCANVVTRRHWAAMGGDSRVRESGRPQGDARPQPRAKPPNLRHCAARQSSPSGRRSNPSFPQGRRFFWGCGTTVCRGGFETRPYRRWHCAAHGTNQRAGCPHTRNICLLCRCLCPKGRGSKRGAQDAPPALSLSSLRGAVSCAAIGLFLGNLLCACGRGLECGAFFVLRTLRTRQAAALFNHPNKGLHHA